MIICLYNSNTDGNVDPAVLNGVWVFENFSTLFYGSGSDELDWEYSQRFEEIEALIIQDGEVSLHMVDASGNISLNAEVKGPGIVVEIPETNKNGKTVPTEYLLYMYNDGAMHAVETEKPMEGYGYTAEGTEHIRFSRYDLNIYADNPPAEGRWYVDDLFTNENREKRATMTNLIRSADIVVDQDNHITVEIEGEIYSGPFRVGKDKFSFVFEHDGRNFQIANYADASGRTIWWISLNTTS